MDISNTACIFELNHWAMAFAYYQHRLLYGINPDYYYTNELNTRVRYSPSNNNFEIEAALSLANLQSIDVVYDTLVLPFTMEVVGGRTPNGATWRVFEGGNYISITNNVATITRPAYDVDIIIIFKLHSRGNDGFAVDRAFFITIKGTG